MYRNYINETSLPQRPSKTVIVHMSSFYNSRLIRVCVQCQWRVCLCIWKKHYICCTLLQYVNTRVIISKIPACFLKRLRTGCHVSVNVKFICIMHVFVKPTQCILTMKTVNVICNCLIQLVVGVLFSGLQESVRLLFCWS